MGGPVALKTYWWCTQLTTDSFQYSLKFQVVSVAHLPDWTSCHQQDQSLCSMHSWRVRGEKVLTNIRLKMRYKKFLNYKSAVYSNNTSLTTAKSHDIVGNSPKSIWSFSITLLTKNKKNDWEMFIALFCHSCCLLLMPFCHKIMNFHVWASCFSYKKQYSNTLFYGSFCCFFLLQSFKTNTENKTGIIALLYTGVMLNLLM